MDFGALRELARLGKRGRCSPPHQRDGENERDCDFHENPPACTSVQVIPVTWGGGLRSETRRWRADLAPAAGRGKVVGEELQPGFSLFHRFRQCVNCFGACALSSNSRQRRRARNRSAARVSPAGTIVLTTPSGRVTSMNWLRGKRYVKLYLVVGEKLTIRAWNFGLCATRSREPRQARKGATVPGKPSVPRRLRSSSILEKCRQSVMQKQFGRLPA